MSLSSELKLLIPILEYLESESNDIKHLEDLIKACNDVDVSIDMFHPRTGVHVLSLAKYNKFVFILLLSKGANAVSQLARYWDYFLDCMDSLIQMAFHMKKIRNRSITTIIDLHYKNPRFEKWLMRVNLDASGLWKAISAIYHHVYQDHNDEKRALDFLKVILNRDIDAIVKNSSSEIEYHIEEILNICCDAFPTLYFDRLLESKCIANLLLNHRHISTAAWYDKPEYLAVDMIRSITSGEPSTGIKIVLSVLKRLSSSWEKALYELFPGPVNACKCPMEPDHPRDEDCPFQKRIPRTVTLFTSKTATLLLNLGLISNDKEFKVFLNCQDNSKVFCPLITKKYTNISGDSINIIMEYLFKPDKNSNFKQRKVVPEFSLLPASVNLGQQTYSPTYSPTYEPTYEPKYSPTYEPTYSPTSPSSYKRKGSDVSSHLLPKKRKTRSN